MTALPSAVKPVPGSGVSVLDSVPVSGVVSFFGLSCDSSSLGTVVTGVVVVGCFCRVGCCSGSFPGSGSGSDSTGQSKGSGSGRQSTVADVVALVPFSRVACT